MSCLSTYSPPGGSGYFIGVDCRVRLCNWAMWLGGFRIQPTFTLVRVVRGDLSWDINCLIPPAHCVLGLLACSEAYEFGQLGTGLSWFR